MKTLSKPAMIHALRAFVAQRSGIEWGNYSSGDYKSSRAAFMGDYRPILKNGRHAREMLRSVELRESISAQDLVDASRAFSGRLQFKFEEDGSCAVDYCTGQYFPTEYRAAACAVLASALWAYWRSCAPADCKDVGEYIRKQARNELGRGIARDWFSN